jgi:Uma2 family endonuclease
MVTKSRATIDDLHALPDDGSGYEIVGGELRRLPVPNEEHSEIDALTAAELLAHVRPRKLGRVYVELHCVLSRDPLEVRLPDVAFVRAERVPHGARRRVPFEGAPDLAVEIVSPSQTFGQAQEKARFFLAAGSRLAWVIEPQRRTVTVYRPDHAPVTVGDDGTLDGGDVLPGLALPVSRLFE